jgi:hypothetical protein
MRVSAIVLVTLLALSLLGGCDDQPRLDGRSLFALHQSTQSMKKELKLSKKSAAALDNGIDVLVGDAIRALIEEQEARAASDPEERAREEALALSAVDDLTMQEVLASALDLRRAELQGLVTELGAEEVVVAEQQGHLDAIRVLRARYDMVMSTRRSWIDFTISNLTDQTLSEVVLDCKLVEPSSRHPREKGTCVLEFPNGLPPRSSATARTIVGWDTQPRAERRVEARPIRAHGPDRVVLWQVPSELDPREGGRVGDMRVRVAVLEESMRGLEIEPIAAP